MISDFQDAPRLSGQARGGVNSLPDFNVVNPKIMTASEKPGPWPARMDLLQSVSGLLLGLFMWLHMLFVSSILLGEEAMWTVARFFEGYFFFGYGLPWLVSLFVASIFGLFVLHAWLALRKFPAQWRQHRVYWAHMRSMRHEDTTLWFVQVITGFGMFFLAPVHLYLMMMHPELIGPYESADRVWSGMMWPLYLVLLFLVELHGGIGLYRLAVKWGDFSDPASARRKLKRLKWGFTVFFLVLGLVTLAAYIKLGIEHAPQAGERWIPQKSAESSFPRMRESSAVTSLDSRMRGNDGFFGALPAIPASMRAAP